jgi:hypothetical protein
MQCRLASRFIATSAEASSNRQMNPACRVSRTKKNPRLLAFL